MSSFRENLHAELEEFELIADIKAIVKKENRRRKKRAVTAASFAAVMLAAGAMALILIKPVRTSNIESNTAAVETNAVETTRAAEHSLKIVSGALAKIAEKPRSGTDKNSGDVYMLQCCFKCSYYINGVVYDMDDEALNEIFAQHDVRVQKSFEILGDNSFWVEGEDVATVKCTAENGAFMLSDEAERTYSPKHTIELDGGSANDSISYLFPAELNSWIEEENETNLPIDYSKAPTDNITVAVTFTDGTEQSVKVKLYFNDYGYLVVETEDGTKYNDGGKNDYEKWKNGSDYDENGDLISWDYSGRTDEKMTLD